MAFIAYGPGAAHAFPGVFQDPKYPKDIVINGILFDIDTFTPKIGSHVMSHMGDQGTTGGPSWSTIDDDDGYVYGVWNGDHISGQYINTFAPNYPYVSRDTKTDYSHYNATDNTQISHYINCNTSLWHRDWLEHPLKIWHLNTTINEYLGMWPYADQGGQRRHYEANDGKTLYQDGTYASTGAEYGYNIIDPDTNSGMLYRQIHNDANKTIQQLVVINYSSNSNLRTLTKTEIYAPTTTAATYIHHLTKCNNGDHFFLAHESSASVGGNNTSQDIIRYDNSSNSIVTEYSNWANAADPNYPFQVPSNVVYHQESGESTTSKKICYHWVVRTTSFDSTTNQFYLIEMDIAAATITRTLCSWTAPPIPNTEDDISTTVNNSNMGPRYLFENRIISASQDINSQKYLFTFVMNNGFYSANHDGSYMFLEILPSNAASLAPLTSSTTYGKWSDILTASSKLVNPQDIIPWCVAPLNVEHSLMMVFTKHSTHVVKFDTSAETFSEVWMDDYGVFTQVMWMPSGKVLTGEVNPDFQSTNGITDHHAPQPIQVWSEDLIYNIDILTSADYVTYSGSDVSNTLSISAYDGNDARVATDLTLKIIGSAIFDNSTTTKTVTTSTSAHVTETITIQDSGHIEIQVVEVQTQ